jgi:hypothetical protein
LAPGKPGAFVLYSLLVEINKIPAFYINMDADVHKKESTESVLKILGFESVTRISGIEGLGKIVGCTMAHIKAIGTALESTSGPFAIFEDDIFIKNPNTTIDVPDSADALYVGISRWGIYNGTGHTRISVEQHSRDLYRIYNMLSTHGIVYFNRDYAKLLMRSYDFLVSVSEPVDKANAELVKYFEVYGLTDPMVYQDGINEKETNFTLPGPNATNKFGAFALK